MSDHLKKILVATDLSARSDRALQRALTLAYERQAELEILHVVDDTWPQKIIEQHEASAGRGIVEQIAALPASRDVRFSTTVVRGQDYREIIRRSEEIGADLIVLGVHRTALRELFRGTTAERVLRLGRKPVLVVKDPVARSYRRVLVGADLSVHSRRAISVAAELAPSGEFLLVHATHVPFIGFLGRESTEALVRDEQREFEAALEKEIRELKERLGTSAPNFKTAVMEGPVSAVIRAKMEEFQPDLIAVGTHGRTAISGLVLGSIAEDLLAEAPVDVVAVKAW